MTTFIIQLLIAAAMGGAVVYAATDNLKSYIWDVNSQAATEIVTELVDRCGILA